MKRAKTRLVLSRETIRALDVADLRIVNGGLSIRTNCVTKCCPPPPPPL